MERTSEASKVVRLARREAQGDPARLTEHGRICTECFFKIPAPPRCTLNITYIVSLYIVAPCVTKPLHQTSELTLNPHHATVVLMP
jgi:hypothetical protein